MGLGPGPFGEESMEMGNLSKEIKHLGRGGSISHKTPLSASFQFDFKTLIFICPPPSCKNIKGRRTPRASIIHYVFNCVAGQFQLSEMFLMISCVIRKLCRLNADKKRQKLNYGRNDERLRGRLACTD